MTSKTFVSSFLCKKPLFFLACWLFFVDTFHLCNNVWRQYHYENYSICVTTLDVKLYVPDVCFNLINTIFNYFFLFIRKKIYELVL